MPTATELAALSVRLLRENGDESASLAMALLGHGRATGYSGDRTTGIALLEEALALARVLDHPLFIGASSRQSGRVRLSGRRSGASDDPRDRGAGGAAPPSTPVGDVLLARLARGDRVGTIRSACRRRLLRRVDRTRPGAGRHHISRRRPGSHRHDRRRSGRGGAAQRDCWERRKRCPRSPEPGPSSPPAVRIAGRSTRPARRWARNRSPRRGNRAGGSRGSRQRPRRCKRPNRCAWCEPEPSLGQP